MSGNQSRGRGLQRAVGVTGIVVVALGAAVATTGGVLAAVMARTVVTPPVARPDDTRVIAVDQAGGTVTLQSTPDSVLPGDYSFFFSAGAGHAQLGEVVTATARTVTRRILSVDQGDLNTAQQGRFSGWLYRGPEDLPYAFSNVIVPLEFGQGAPAWLIPAEKPADHWVIQVHGRAVTRAEGLRAVPVFRSAGYTSLLISYRNDGDAPPSGDGRYSLGDTEWHDVDAAIEFAARHGARSIVLMGWSMGGAIVLQTATRTSHSQLLAGIVLESPVIDWADVVAYQGVELRLPTFIARAAMEVMGRRWGGLITGQSVPIDFRRLDFVDRADELEHPMLLLHSNDDGFVPVTGSRQLATLRSDIVTFVPFGVARHTKLWNYDRERWNSTITTWLAELPHAAPPPAELS
ncbi:alpha/beta fold hydrolase [Cryobacterium sp. CG_9.6]|uniref:alpha/beta hydrolase family protein n=1 Tax=Cryobacterium sp. CG_9.6 TaxID=2760710 RepID=UPI0024750ADD|nr:alpha/beta fold hydrolase [Cryobacterium sp. CG_9.6]MDH6237332.1 alpha-beta hydrolase superfamily lysophospholipase [Cryobacterium sp. CG_9.6]